MFDLKEALGQLKGDAVEYLEFLNVPAMNCGVCSLAADSTDMQKPHDEEKVYLVLKGRARMRLGDKEREVKPGAVLYVKSATEHSFSRSRKTCNCWCFSPPVCWNTTSSIRSSGVFLSSPTHTLRGGLHSRGKAPGVSKNADSGNSHDGSFVRPHPAGAQ